MLLVLLLLFVGLYGGILKGRPLIGASTGLAVGLLLSVIVGATWLGLPYPPCYTDAKGVMQVLVAYPSPLCGPDP